MEGKKRFFSQWPDENCSVKEELPVSERSGEQKKGVLTVTLIS